MCAQAGARCARAATSFSVSMIDDLVHQAVGVQTADTMCSLLEACCHGLAWLMNVHLLPHRPSVASLHE